MLPQARVLVIDDELPHLKGISDGLHHYGAACLPIHFQGDPSIIKPCAQMRVLVTDLHLTTGGASSSFSKDFATIGGLIENTIKPHGPYIIILWTKHPEQAAALRDYLEIIAAKPFAVLQLDKAAYMDLVTGQVKDIEKLVTTIGQMVQSEPQIAALLDWEERVLGAAAKTISAILSMTNVFPDSASRAAAIRRLLSHLAVESVGEGHVDADRFQAINEALLPILADRISFLRSEPKARSLWEKAFSMQDKEIALSWEEAAKLNRLSHIEQDINGLQGTERGVALCLPVDYLTSDKGPSLFEGLFGLNDTDAASTEFCCDNYKTGDAQFRWILIQIQAICDFAQQNPGSVPFVLSLEIPSHCASSKTPPASLWKSPRLYLDSSDRVIGANFRFQVCLSREHARAATIAYRIREPLLSELSHRLHSYGARPGLITFRGPKKDPKPPSGNKTASPDAPKRDPGSADGEQQKSPRPRRVGKGSPERGNCHSEQAAVTPIAAQEKAEEKSPVQKK